MVFTRRMIQGFRFVCMGVQRTEVKQQRLESNMRDIINLRDGYKEKGKEVIKRQITVWNICQACKHEGKLTNMEREF